MWPVRYKERQVETLHLLAHYIDAGGEVSFEQLEAIGTTDDVHYSIVVKDAPRYWRAWPQRRSDSERPRQARGLSESLRGGRDA